MNGPAPGKSDIAFFSPHLVPRREALRRDPLVSPALPPSDKCLFWPEVAPLKTGLASQIRLIICKSDSDLAPFFPH